MNENLEIKQLCKSIRDYSENDLCFGTIRTLKMIESTAERMSAEGERLNASLNEESIRANVLERCVEERENEIACLKAELENKSQQISDMRGCLHDYEERMAELEKRPEIIYCFECQIVCGMEDDCAWCGLKSHHNKIKDPYKEFCSRGQRRESEEKR